MLNSTQNTRYDLLATCAFGLESIVRRELESLDLPASVVEPGRVAFQGDRQAIGKANLWLRTADRVLIKVARFPSKDFDELFETTRNFEWGEHIPRNGEFPVNGRCIRSQLTSVPACQRSIKRAMAEALMRDHSCNELPENGAEFKIDFTILKDEATLTIDTSGQGLHRRGYHTAGSSPQVKETLAAALVMLSYWQSGRPMIDPFCRGGTIAIEAALQGLKIAPGINRKFSCEQWPNFPRILWHDLRSDAIANQIPALETRILATDSASRFIRKARFNASLAGVESSIHFETKSPDQTTNQRRFGCLITLPPSEKEAASSRELQEQYKQLPDIFRKLPTWSHYLLTDFPGFESIVGRKADRRRKLYSGGVAMTYYQFHGPKPVRGEQSAAVHQSATSDQPNTSKSEGGDPSLTADPSSRGESVGRLVEPEPTVRQLALDHDSNSTEQALEINSILASANKETEATPVIQPPDRDQAETNGDKQNQVIQQPADKSGKPYEHAVGPAAFGELTQKSVEQAALFSTRLRKRAKHFRRWPSKRGITCYRIYERDIPEIPLVVDIYEDCLHLTEYDRPHERSIAEHANWLDLMAKTAAETLDVHPRDIHFKRRGRQRGKTQHDKVAETHLRKTVNEGGLKFLVNLADYVDTGLFLDHRITRGMVRDQAKDKTFLNLFSYTGAFTVYAAAGGATKTVSVDLSRTYLHWAKENLELNQLAGEKHNFIANDVMQFLEDHSKRPTYDLVVVDPPTFSNSKRTENDWTVQGRVEELFQKLIPLVHPGGVIYFSTNFRRFKFDPESLPLAESYEISKQTVPEDFRNRRIHRCWRMVR